MRFVEQSSAAQSFSPRQTPAASGFAQDRSQPARSVVGRRYSTVQGNP
jgi:hypothetical protein